MDTPTPTANGTVAPGTVLGGRYRLVSRIGAGGMAVIYRARDLSLDRDVAVKLLHTHLGDDPVVLARFRTEARHAAALNHPHVVGVYDQGAGGTDGDVPYIVMEHIDGPSLREVLQQRGALQPGEVLSLVEPVCRALARAHELGLVHRDIKPENLLVSEDGIPKVADFGIARAVAATNLTQTGTLVGSVHYLAPELVDGREATPASDQYALGVVLFELLANRKPLPAESPMAIALRHAREPIPAPSAFADGIPAALDAVVARATALDPRERFADLRELAEALIAAVPDGPAEVTITHAQGDDEQTLVVPADVVGSSTPPYPLELEGVVPVGRRRSAVRRVAVWLAVLLLVAGLLAGGTWAAWNFGVAPEQDVPQLVGLHRTAAVSELEPLGLLLTVSAQRHELAVPEGEVLEQDPPPGAPLRRGGTVSVVVSLGPEPVTMPTVLGLPRAEAVGLLEGPPYHFTVARIDESFHDEVPAGAVVGQRPDPDVGLRAGAEVVLNVSLGIEQVPVPELGGLTREQAETALAEARLALGEVTGVWSDEVPTAGVVVGQSLEPGVAVDKGATVDLVVSRGPLTIELPNVRGQGIDAARAQLEALALKVRVEGVPRQRIGPFRRGEFGRVEEQVPSPGTSVQRGETITLYTFSEDAED
jgi:eukaryotic-like serine/threonine-protein kinase